MAFIVIRRAPGVGDEDYLAPSSTSFTAGQLIYRNTNTGLVNIATTNRSTITQVEAIVTKTGSTSSGTAYVRACPLHDGLRVIADCTNNSAENQLNIAHALTDASTVNNTSSHSASSCSVFIALAVVGAATDKKLYGYIAKTGQVSA